METILIILCYLDNPMARKYDAEFILNLKAQYVLSDVVRETHTNLRNAGGGEWVGQCPFHDEDTASFRVNDERYHCFGCGAHGDIVSWVQINRGLSFAQTIQALTKHDIPDAGLKIERKKPKVNVSVYEADEVALAIDINQLAHDFFIGNDKPPYIDERGLSECLELGYASVDSNEMLNYLEPEFTRNPKDLMDIGLTIQDSRGNYFPRLRDRITIPLRNPAGHILGFAGRIVPRPENESLPKYINPPNTHAFNKRNYLYGWHTFKGKPPYDYAILVEGYFDVLSLHANGINNVLAIMGTSIAKGQINYLEATVKRVFTMFDGDMPGLEATFNASKVLIESKFDVQHILLTDGADPDSLCQEYKKKIRDKIKEFPRIKLTDFYGDKLVTKLLKPEYDRSQLDELIRPYVLDNIKQGLPHYNVVDWVMQAYPQYREEIKETALKMINDVERQPDGKLKLKEVNIKAFIKAWIKPCRYVRKKHENK